ncbi:MAG: hypothetical protein PHU23_10280, partial [Dehalococcoidales bacterium]|nr:hypothetical protein [Dehalococcoidales bacterium]
LNDAAKLKSNWQIALSSCNLTPRRLAGETGISHTWLYAIMGGRVVPSDSIKTRLLARLPGYTGSELFPLLPPAPKPSNGVVCKRCHSARTIKSGVFNGNQRYQCRDCGCVFINSGSVLRGRLPVEAVATVLERFFEAESLASICRLVEESGQVRISMSGIENLVSRFSRQALKLTGDILPPLSSQWILQCTSIPAERPVAVLDVLDMNSGFIIASDLVPACIEKDRENVVQKAVRLAGSWPESLVLGLGFASFGPDLAMAVENTMRKVNFERHHWELLSKFSERVDPRTRLISRRLSCGSLASGRLICSAWRVHYNFLSGFNPAGVSRFNSWRDIIVESQVY